MPPYNLSVQTASAQAVPNKRLRYDSCIEPPAASNVAHVLVPKLGSVPVLVLNGNFNALPVDVKQFVAKYVQMTQPRGVHICDGSEEEAAAITEKLVSRGTLVKLNKMDNCYLARTDPADVARVESKTFIVTPTKEESVADVQEGVQGILGNWMSPNQAKTELDARFPRCMKGRTMYVIPFSMGPIGSPLSKVGVQLTDSNYVVLSMRVMTRMSTDVFELIRKGEEYVKCVHSLGCPRPVTRPIVNHWPCNPEKIIITHFPDERLIMSYGSGYGGNSLLGKKCFALRIASRMAKEEGWLAEHMLIMSVTNPAGEEKFIAAAFPSACGKTNMAMLQPTLPGWKVQCIGDDIAWMRFDSEGKLRAINPEAGFFGVAPGTNKKTNPIAVATYQKNSIFTNVGMTQDGEVFWEGMEKDLADRTIPITTWLGQNTWKIGDEGKAAHPNSRFCCPASQCPTIHPKWQDPEGVVIDAIVFGGRRPQGVPLVMEAFNWQHGVMMGAALKSEATAAAEDRGRQIMHDPMAMRPFMGYNFGAYLQHWLSLADHEDYQLPKVFHVNWFRQDEQGKFLWPGFGENIRVLEWMCRRLNGEENIAEESAIGFLPSAGAINLQGLDEEIDMKQLMSVPRDYWQEDMLETQQFLKQQVGRDLPEEIAHQVQQQMDRVNQIVNNREE